jgi:hypothetical protein
LVKIAKERYGEERTLTALDQASATNSNIAVYTQRIAQNAARRAKAAQEHENAPRLTYDEINSLILEKRDKVPRMRLFRWGKSASDEELARAAADLLAEDDPLRLVSYLRLFYRRRFPLDPSRLIALAQAADEEVVWWALEALKWIEHPTIRALAVDLLERGERKAWAVGLLISNYREGDYALIETAIKAEADEDELHAIGRRLLDVVDAHPGRDAASTLTAFYEMGPCSECREDVVDHLLSLDALPDWMRKECRYDANLDLREKLAVPTDHAE